MLSTNFPKIPDEIPLQPAWTRPIVLDTLFTKKIGKQSATFIEQTRLPPLLIIPSAGS